MTRLTNTFFSKKMKDHAHVALHFLYYNFARIHKTLEMVDVPEAWESPN
jgi:hypothetical protein